MFQQNKIALPTTLAALEKAFLNEKIAAWRQSQDTGETKGKSKSKSKPSSSRLSSSFANLNLGENFVDPSLLSSSPVDSTVKVELRDVIGRIKPVSWSVEPDSLVKTNDVWRVPAPQHAALLISEALHESGGVGNRYELVLNQMGKIATYPYLEVAKGGEGILAKKTPFY